MDGAFHSLTSFRLQIQVFSSEENFLLYWTLFRFRSRCSRIIFRNFNYPCVRACYNFCLVLPPLKINLYLFSFSFLESFLNFSFKSLLAFSSKVTFLSLLLMNFYFFPFYLNILISPSFLFTFIGLSAGFLIILVFRFTFYFLLLWVY